MPALFLRFPPTAARSSPFRIQAPDRRACRGLSGGLRTCRIARAGYAPGHPEQPCVSEDHVVLSTRSWGRCRDSGARAVLFPRSRRRCRGPEGPPSVQNHRTGRFLLDIFLTRARKKGKIKMCSSGRFCLQKRFRDNPRRRGPEAHAFCGFPPGAHRLRPGQP